MKIHVTIKSIFISLLILFIFVFISIVFSLKMYHFVIVVLLFYSLGFILPYLRKFYYKFIKKSPIPEPEYDSYAIICKCPVNKRKYLKLLAVYMGLLLIFYFLLYIIETHYFLPKPEYLEIDGRVVELASSRISYRLLFISAVIFHLISELFKKKIYILQFRSDKVSISNEVVDCEIFNENIRSLERISPVELKIEFKDNTNCALIIPETEYVREKDIEIRKEIVDEIITKLTGMINSEKS